MIRMYRVVVQGDRYPMEYSVQASSWSTAAARGVREWQKRFKGSRSEQLTIKLVRSVAPAYQGNPAAEGVAALLEHGK